MNATTYAKPQIFTRVGALSLAIDEGQVHTHIFDFCRLSDRKNPANANPLLATILLDAADHCERCHADLDSFIQYCRVELNPQPPQFS
jgi:hypothetical protein